MISKKNVARITLSVASIATLRTIEVKTGSELPLASYIAPPLVSLLMVHEVYRCWARQTKKSNLISSLRHIKENIKIMNHQKIYVVNIIIAFLLLYVYDTQLTRFCWGDKPLLPDMYNGIYFTTPIISYIGTLAYSVYYKLKILEKMQLKADDIFKGLEVIETSREKTTIMSSKYLNNNDIRTLEMVVDHDISSIIQDKYIKSKYYLMEGKNDYRKLEKGSVARLEQILTNLRDKPELISSTETDVDIIHQFISILPFKKVLRLQDEICYKMGLNKGKLTINTKDGYIYFKLSKSTKKTYLLDDMIENITIDTKKELGFILGVNLDNTYLVIEDLIKLKHLLIAGKTGSGKSCTFKGIVESLMYFNNNIFWYMLDFADSALVKYEDFYNVKYVESELDDINKAINELLVEYENRKKKFRELKVENIQEYNQENESKLPYMIFAIDEANAFKSEMNKKDFEPIENKIKTLLQRGRKYGMFCIMAVQQTNDNDFVKSWKTQFTRVAHLLEDTVDCCNVTTKKEYQQLIPSLDVGEFYVLSEIDNYKLKGCLTDKKHNKLYEILRKGYVKNGTEKDIEIEEKEVHQKSHRITS